MALKPTKDPELKIDDRTGIYYYRGTPVKGAREIARSLGVNNYRSAMQAKRELLWRLRGVDPTERGILFRDYVSAAFLPERKRKAPNTYKMAFYSCQRLLPFLETYTMRQITDSVWDRYIEYAHENYPGTKLGYDRRHLLMMLKRLHEKGAISEMPKLHIPEEKPARRRALLKTEIEAMFKNSEGSIKGLLYFMYFMGCRPGEALGAMWSEVNLETGMWHIPASRVKTRTGRSIKINSTVLAWLKERHAKASSPYIFPSRLNLKKPLDRYNKQWGRMLEKARLRADITPYHLRHTFLTEAAKKVRSGSLNLVMITSYTGTSIEQFEKTYLHIDGEDTKDVAELMDLGGET